MVNLGTENGQNQGKKKVSCHKTGNE